MTEIAFTEHNVDLDSGRVAYLKGGEGRPILHLHPAGGPRVTPVTRMLARRHTYYIPTVPGWNGTPQHAAVGTMADLGDLAAKFIRTVIGGPCDVVAESFGGWQALWLAARHPDLVQQLVVQAPAGLRTEGTGGLPADPEARQRKLFAVIERAPKETRSPEMLAENQRMHAHYSGGVTLDKALQEALPQIKARTLILTAGIPQSRLTYVWGAAHVPEFDQPERTARLIGGFMEHGEGYLVRRPA
jgi:pimeloyl-ACP methyl ester carboxylesterase